MTVPRPLEIQDPRFYPASYDAAADAFMFSSIDEATLLAPFLDARMGEAWHRRAPVAADRIELPEPPRHPSWLFHTAFCCSTLLARALHAPPLAVSLKEPHALMDLATASLAAERLPAGRLEARIEAAVALLGRPWSPAGRVLVKPTNAVNRLLGPLLDATPGSRAVLLHGGLEEFLISCLKKLPGAEQPLRWMVQYLLPGTRLERALGISAQQPFNPIEAAVLVWHAQMEIYADALAADGPDRLRTLSLSTLLERPHAAVAACADWLDLGTGDDDAMKDGRERVTAVFSRNSKAVDVAYDPTTRERERERLRERHAGVVQAALEWVSHSVTPRATLPAAWKPLQVG